MPRIFISYRRDDSRAIAGRIYDSLADAFGEENIFKDVDRIPPGASFAEVLEAELAKCNVLLIIIGQKWVNITDKEGRRRLDDPQDFVRIEVEHGLDRNDLLVIPVLVDEAGVPNPADLPDSLDKIATLQVVQVRHDPDYHRDMDRLIDFLKVLQSQEEKVKATERGVARRSNQRLLLGAGLLIALLVIGFLALLASGRLGPGQPEPPNLETQAVAILATTQQAGVGQTQTAQAFSTINAIMTRFVTQTAAAVQTLATATPQPTRTPLPTDTPTPDASQTAAFLQTRDALSTQQTATAAALAATNNALSTLNAPTNTPQPTDTPTPTPTATASPSPTPPPTPTLPPTLPQMNVDIQATAFINAQATQVAGQSTSAAVTVRIPNGAKVAIHGGPGNTFPVLANENTKDPLRVIGRSRDGGWLQLERRYSNRGAQVPGWLTASSIVVETGNLNDLPVVGG